MTKFRVLAGQHIDDDPDPTAPKGPDGKARDKVYNKGDIVETSKNLLRFNFPGMTEKFELVNDDVPSQNSPRQAPPPAPKNQPQRGKAPTPVPSPLSASEMATLKSMTEAELKQYAASEEIDLKGAKTKEDILKVLEQTGR